MAEDEAGASGPAVEAEEDEVGQQVANEEEEAGVDFEEEEAGAGEDLAGDEDPELVEMKKKIAEMESEADKLKAMQQELQQEAGGEVKDSDAQSIYVGQVDYDATPEELQNHFASCGTINRVTILCDRHTGRSKGYAYVEFEAPDSVQNAIMLDNSIFKGRQLKVTAKRTNQPGKGRGYRGGGFRGGRGFRGRGRGRGGYYGGYRGRGGYRGYRGY